MLPERLTQISTLQLFDLNDVWAGEKMTFGIPFLAHLLAEALEAYILE